MEKTDLTEEQFKRLLNAIFPIVAEKGPSHTTMDAVAHRLSMSKRTLYEIFGSKDNMLVAVLDYIHTLYNKKIYDIIVKADNVMEGIAGVILYQQKMMTSISADFYKDMDMKYKHLRANHEMKSKMWAEALSNEIRRGIEQGVFRKDVNCEIAIQLLRIQMESLKRMESLFPAHITATQLYMEIGKSFLRSIASQKGNDILDRILPEMNTN